MKGRKGKRKLHKYPLVKPALCVLLILAGVFFGTTFAKYYSLQKQKGVAVASDFYFSSDILMEGVILGENERPTDITSYVATGIWNAASTQSTVTFYINNYENKLLYNDDAIHLKYKVYAMLAEEDTSGKIKYELVYKKNASAVELNATTPVEITETLEGGTPLGNVYNIRYTYQSGITILPKDVLVWAVPVEPSYISANVYTLGSKIGVKESTAAFTFEDGWKFIKFDEAELGEPLTDKEKSTINAQVGMVYNVSTTGSNTEGADMDKVQVTLSWNSNYVEMDKFSKYYQDVSASANGIKTISITIDTYTSNDILFYRTNGFDINDTAIFPTKGNFMNLVTAQQVE